MTYQATTERVTRHRFIDQDLARAGWSTSQRSLIEEFVLCAQSEDLRDNPEYADYALLGIDQPPLAIVEAKRTSRDELAGKRQASDYADRIKARFGDAPFIFFTNGQTLQFWDRERYPPRKIAGFYTHDDLERLRHQRRYAESLAGIAINPDIAGRDYQNEAIRRVTEGIEAAKRRILLVMATGTGKTRTTIAMVDVLLRAKRTQRILFLADRRELVRQAMAEFKSHIPNESLARIEGGDTSGARIQFATYPSMMQVYHPMLRPSVGRVSVSAFTSPATPRHIAIQFNDDEAPQRAATLVAAARWGNDVNEQLDAGISTLVAKSARDRGLGRHSTADSVRELIQDDIVWKREHLGKEERTMRLAAALKSQLDQHIPDIIAELA